MSRSGQLVKKFKEDKKAVAQLNQSVSVAYLLVQMANDYIEDANDMLRAYGVNIHEIKQYFGIYRKAFNNYHKFMFAMIENEQGKRDLLRDFDGLRKMIDCFVKGKDPGE